MRILIAVILFAACWVSFNLPKLHAELSPAEKKAVVEKYKPEEGLKEAPVVVSELDELKARLAEREKARAKVFNEYQRVAKEQADRERTVERFNGSIVELKDQIAVIEDAK